MTTRLQERFNKIRKSKTWYVDEVGYGSVLLKWNTGSCPGMFESLVIWARINGRWVGNYPSVEAMRQDFVEKARMYAKAVKDIDKHG